MKIDEVIKSNSECEKIGITCKTENEANELLIQLYRRGIKFRTINPKNEQEVKVKNHYRDNDDVGLTTYCPLRERIFYSSSTFYEEHGVKCIPFSEIEFDEEISMLEYICSKNRPAIHCGNIKNACSIVENFQKYGVDWVNKNGYILSRGTIIDDDNYDICLHLTIHGFEAKGIYDVCEEKIGVIPYSLIIE